MTCDHPHIRYEEVDVGFYGTVIRKECVVCGEVLNK